MKAVVSLAIGLLLILGVAAGIAATWQNSKQPPGTVAVAPLQPAESGRSTAPLPSSEPAQALGPRPVYSIDKEPPALVPLDQPQPKCVVDNTTHEFAGQAVGTEGRHAFVFANHGQSPLVLVQGGSSCKCTFSSLENGTLQPGQTTEVVLQWTPKAETTLFREMATILTNDRQRQAVELMVTGSVYAPFKADPPEWNLTNCVSSETFNKQVKIFSTIAAPVAITGIECTDSRTKDFFDVTLKDLPRDQWPDPQVIRQGWQLNVQIKPGLPSGEFTQVIRLKTNHPTASSFEWPVSGTMVGEVSLFSTLPEWGKQNSALMLGTVSKEKGARRTIAVQLRGPNKDQIRVRISKMEPGFLVARLGEPNLSSKLVTIPLEIEIPAGSPNGVYVGGEDAPAAWIELQTENADVETVRVQIAFSILE